MFKSQDQGASTREFTRRLVSRARAKHALDCSGNMLKRLEREGKLTPLRLGARNVFYKADEIEGLISKMERPS